MGVTLTETLAIDGRDADASCLADFRPYQLALSRSGLRRKASSCRGSSSQASLASKYNSSKKRRDLVARRLHRLPLVFSLQYGWSTPLFSCRPARNAFAQWPFAPFAALLACFLRSLTDSARPSSTSIVVSQLTHASVILTPLFRPDGPSAGTF